MGNVSSLSRWSSQMATPNLGDMPESFIAQVFTYLQPHEICKLAMVNRTFRDASLSDFIWKKKLPANYRYLRRLITTEDESGAIWMKDLYATLCSPNRFDNGNKEVWIERSSGGLCMAISSRALKIAGFRDRRLWDLIHTEESRFKTVAYLRKAWWVEVGGELEFRFAVGTYSVFFKVRLGRCSTIRGNSSAAKEDRINGWDVKPVRFELSSNCGRSSVSQCFLKNQRKWAYYHVGDFVVDEPHKDTVIRYSLSQIDCTHTKGGLCIDSVFVYPRGFHLHSELGLLL